MKAGNGPGPGSPPPRAIIFDWDNTLVDVWPAIHDALNTTFVAMDHPPWSLVETRSRVRESLRDSLPEMFGARWTEARKIFYDRYAAVHL
ncbi:MAG: HAD hydrolase-like protein, partial [Alphaproteobacteria bacterium]